MAEFVPNVSEPPEMEFAALPALSNAPLVSVSLSPLLIARFVLEPVLVRTSARMLVLAPIAAGLLLSLTFVLAVTALLYCELASRVTP